MNTLQRYIFRLLIRNFLLSLILFCGLFLMIDFFDRIDNIIAAGGTFWSSIQYFLFKIPLTASLMSSLALLVATLFTYGLLSKSGELTAMRAAGLSIRTLAQPLLLCGIVLSSVILLFNETLVPLCTRRVKEIYNFDIQKKDLTGSYSQSDLWWRKENQFMFLNDFDSRTNTMLQLSIFSLDRTFTVQKRIDALTGKWIDPMLGWTLKNVTERHFRSDTITDQQTIPSFPLAITDEPQEFYDIKAEPDTMSFRELRRYIRKLRQSGSSVHRQEVDLNAKLAFPFVGFVISWVALPFALKPARTGSLALSFLAGITIGFSYYVFHSISISLGHAELLPAVVAAWTANVFMLCIGTILNLGAEAPR